MTVEPALALKSALICMLLALLSVGCAEEKAFPIGEPVDLDLGAIEVRDVEFDCRVENKLYVASWTPDSAPFYSSNPYPVWQEEIPGAQVYLGAECWYADGSWFEEYSLVDPPTGGCGVESAALEEGKTYIITSVGAYGEMPLDGWRYTHAGPTCMNSRFLQVTIPNGQSTWRPTPEQLPGG